MLGLGLWHAAALAGVKPLGRGVLAHSCPLWSSAAWNALDAFVVFVSLLQLLPGMGNVSALRGVRVLRPLRSVSRIPGMRVRVGRGRRAAAGSDAAPLAGLPGAWPAAAVSGLRAGGGGGGKAWRWACNCVLLIAPRSGAR